MEERVVESAGVAALPTRTLSLWLSDIEGSTGLLETHGEDYIVALQQHRAEARRACLFHAGELVEARGDSLFAVFPDARGALDCARELRDLWESAPVGGVELRVRFGLHVGQLQPLDDGFAGLDLHLAARVCEAAHGGQILASAAFVEALGDEENELRPLGSFSLRGLNVPCDLLELPSKRHPRQFPPPRTPDTFAGTLRAPVDSFIGRRRQLDQLDAHFRDGTRLLSVCGPGGVGKTRLALQWTRGQRAHFKDGAFWVDLAPVEGTTDPNEAAARVAQAVSGALGLPDDAGEPGERVGSWLARRQLLLVLDNCEHLLEGTLPLASWLAQSAGLCVIATSREVLRLRGERVFRLDPLSLPTDDSPASLERSEAALLLTGRAAEGDCDFQLTPEDAPFVANLCRRLDGLPLALELVAPHLCAQGPRATLEELERRGALEFSGPRDSNPRHRTLGDLVEWSYHALDEAARRVFRALGAFSGGATREAIAAVSGQSPKVLSVLIDGHLVRGARAGRITVLETLREFAWHQARREDEWSLWRRRHAEYFADLAAREETGTLAQSEEEANLRVALEFWREHDVRRFGQMIVHLAPMWEWRALFREGRGWIECALELLPCDCGDLRLSLQAALAEMSFLLADFDSVENAVEQVLSASPQGVEGAAMTARARVSRGFGRLYHLNYTDAGLDFEAAIALFDILGDDSGLAATIGAYGVVQLNLHGDINGAIELYERAIARGQNYPDTLAITTFYLGDVLGPVAGRWEEARPHFERAIELARAARHPVFEGYALWGLAGVEREAGNLDCVREHNARIAFIIREYGHGWAAPYFLESCAHLAIVENKNEEAATLLGAAQTIRQAIDVPLALSYGPLCERMEARLQSQGDATTLHRAREKGASLSFENSLALAIQLGTTV